MAETGIAFDAKNKWFYVKGSNQRLKGLHDVLARQFHPAGSCHSNLKHKRFAKGTQKKLTTATGNSLPALSNRRAKNLGSRVDSQMRVLVEASGGDALQLRYWVTFNKSQRTLADFTSKQRKKRPVAKLEPYAAAALRCLLDNSWIPVACQLPVGSADHGLATAVDVVCKHATDASRVADIEVKTGYDRSWNADTGQCLQRPLEALKDSYRNKAHLQIACTALLHKASTRAKKLPEMYVLRVCRTQGASLEPIEPKIRDQLQAVANRLVSTN